MSHRFELHRDEDASGVSGVGLVAEGVEFRDGAVALRWVVGTLRNRSTVIYADVRAVLAVHGHGGRTRLVWLDDV